MEFTVAAGVYVCPFGPDEHVGRRLSELRSRLAFRRHLVLAHHADIRRHPTTAGGFVELVEAIEGEELTRKVMTYKRSSRHQYVPRSVPAFKAPLRGRSSVATSRRRRDVAQPVAATVPRLPSPPLVKKCTVWLRRESSLEASLSLVVPGPMETAATVMLCPISSTCSVVSVPSCSSVSSTPSSGHASIVSRIASFDPFLSTSPPRAISGYPPVECGSEEEDKLSVASSVLLTHQSISLTSLRSVENWFTSEGAIPAALPSRVQTPDWERIDQIVESDSRSHAQVSLIDGWRPSFNPTLVASMIANMLAADMTQSNQVIASRILEQLGIVSGDDISNTFIRSLVDATVEFEGLLVNQIMATQQQAQVLGTSDMAHFAVCCDLARRQGRPGRVVTTSTVSTTD